MQREIPLPILLNCWKHHLEFLRRKIELCSNLQEIAENIKSLGENSIDLYIGHLTPKEISDEVIVLLLNNKILAEEQFRVWISESPKRFRELDLSDGSQWTILPGTKPNRYVHIHPSRYSSKTIRIKAQSIKTALGLVIMQSKKSFNQIPLKSINEIRQNMLGLSPTKNAKTSVGIKRVYQLLTSEV
jgi:hypothetical protein